MIDIQNKLLKDLNQKKLDTSFMRHDPDKNNPFNQTATLIIGREKDRIIYKELLFKYQFLQLKKQMHSLSRNLEVWIGFDESKGDLIQVCLCLLGRKGDVTLAISQNKGWIDNSFKKVVINRLPFKGPAIALVGSDGSGKSTITTDLEKWLSNKLNCHRYYLGSGDHYDSIYKRSIKMVRRRFKTDKILTAERTGKNSVNQTEKKGLRNLFVYINTYYLYRISVHSLIQLKKSKRFSDRGGICLFDRYPQNQFLGINDGPKIRRSYGENKSSIIQRLINKEEENIKMCVEMSPDLVIKLIISPETGMLRKPDHNILELEKKAGIINDLNFEHAVVRNIDANLKYEEVLKMTKKTIWDYLYQLSNTNN